MMAMSSVGRPRLGFTDDEKRIAERYATRFGLHSTRLTLKRRRGARFVYLIGTSEDNIDYRIRFDKVKRMRRYNGRNQALDKVEYFKVRAEKVHGEKYDYSMIEEDDLKNRGKVPIICKRNDAHGVFYQDSGNHINHGKGCPKCGKNKLKSMQSF